MAKNKEYTNLYLLSKKERKTAERYGINTQDYGFNRPDRMFSPHSKRDPRKFSGDVAAAANNDYDTRRSVEAAALSGKKKAQKYAKKGFSGLEDVTKANNMFRRMHKRRGNDGDFSSQSDYSGLTYDLVKRDRDKLIERFSEPKEFLTKYIDTNRTNPQNESTQAEVEIPSTPTASGDGSINSPISQANAIDIAGDKNNVRQRNDITQEIDNSSDNSDNSSKIFLDRYKLNLGKKFKMFA